MNGIITQEQAQALDKLVQKVERGCPGGSGGQEGCALCGGSGKVHPYAETGLAGWLAAHGGEWPSLVWRRMPLSHGLTQIWDWWPTPEFHTTLPPSSEVITYYHALTTLQALELLEECYGFGINKAEFGGWYAGCPPYPPTKSIPAFPNQGLLTAAELVNKILEVLP